MPRPVEPFRFRQFSVAHDRSSMRVNTDAVLLGAWAPLPASPERILDIGTGSGVIALMLAQRCSEAKITAIDIDEASVSQARENFLASPWPERLAAENISLQELASRNPKSPKEPRQPSFDLIISNPPFFRDALRNPDPTRRQARHTDTLSFDELCSCSAALLAPEGRLALILPADAEADILACAVRYGLHPTHLTRFYSNAALPPKRILLALKKSPPCRDGIPCRLSREPIPENLTLGSEEYRALCGDFYLGIQ